MQPTSQNSEKSTHWTPGPYQGKGKGTLGSVEGVRGRI